MWAHQRHARGTIVKMTIKQLMFAGPKGQSRLATEVQHGILQGNNAEAKTEANRKIISPKRRFFLPWNFLDFSAWTCRVRRSRCGRRPSRC